MDNDPWHRMSEGQSNVGALATLGSDTMGQCLIVLFDHWLPPVVIFHTLFHRFFPVSRIFFNPSRISSKLMSGTTVQERRTSS